MSAVSNPDRYDQELRIHNLRNDPGVRALYDWMIGRRDALNRRWPTTYGEELLVIQGEARGLQKLISLIENGPTIKPTVEGKQHGN